MPKTYVSNAYMGTVYAKVKGDAMGITREERAFSGNVKAGNVQVSGGHSQAKEYDNRMTAMGFTRIVSGQSTPFEPETRGGKTVYVTIVTADERHVCANHPFGVGQNVIIDPSATVRLAKKKLFGKYKKWVDESGTRYNRRTVDMVFDSGSECSRSGSINSGKCIRRSGSRTSLASEGSIEDLGFLSSYDH